MVIPYDLKHGIACWLKRLNTILQQVKAEG